VRTAPAFASGRTTIASRHRMIARLLRRARAPVLLQHAEHHLAEPRPGGRARERGLQPPKRGSVAWESRPRRRQPALPIHPMKLLQFGTPHGARGPGQDEPVVEERHGHGDGNQIALSGSGAQVAAISTTASAASMLSVHQHATASAGRSVPRLMPTGVSPLGAVMQTAARSKAAR
jgi:hypothetical protein